MKKHGALLLSPNEQSDIIRFAQDRGAYDIWIRYTDSTMRDSGKIGFTVIRGDVLAGSVVKNLELN